MNRLTIVVLASLLAACAGVDSSHLKPVAADKSLTLKSPVVYSEHYSFAGNRFFYTIDAGVYVARFQDDGGIYYEGPSNCLTIKVESAGKYQPQPQRLRCGLYIPGQASLEPKLYYYRDTGVSANTTVQVVDGKGLPATTLSTGAGTGLGMGLVHAIDAAELKNLHFHRDQPKPGQIKNALQ